MIILVNTWLGIVSVFQGRIADVTVAVDRHAGAVHELEKELNGMEDQVFAEFCTRIGVDNIR